MDLCGVTMETPVGEKVGSCLFLFCFSPSVSVCALLAPSAHCVWWWAQLFLDLGGRRNGSKLEDRLGLVSASKFNFDCADVSPNG